MAQMAPALNRKLLGFPTLLPIVKCLLMFVKIPAIDITNLHVARLLLH